MAPSRWLYIAFQSTHPRRVRRDGGDRYYDSSDVSIHAPTQGATNGFSGHLASSLSFNPRTHAGCDFVRLEHRAARVVSIHAPTQGATSRISGASGGRRVFQSTHPRRVRLISASIAGMSASFQSTHPRRVRRDHQADCELAWTFQSTHPRRVRRRPCGSGRTPAGFNPRTHAGCDCGGPCSALSFNPRTHAGCDVIRYCARKLGVFQSTHPRRVRHADAELAVIGGNVSIHAPTQGATGQSASQPAGSSRFNPRTHAGCDYSSQDASTARACFNPRTHAGCDCLFVTPSYCNKKRDVCEPHPGQFKTPRCRHHLSYRQTKTSTYEIANLHRETPCHLWFARLLKHQGRIQIQHRLRTHMLDPIAPLPTQIVEPQTVLGRVDRFL